MPVGSSMDLSTFQQFEIERLKRAIDNTTDIETLKAISKQLLQAWQVQRAATNWVIHHQFGAPAGRTPDGLSQTPLLP